MPHHFIEHNLLMDLFLILGFEPTNLDASPILRAQSMGARAQRGEEGGLQPGP